MEVPRFFGSADTPSTTPAPDPDEIPRLDGVDVLLVDDEPDSLEVAATALRIFGASVTTAFSSDEALEILRRAAFDVVVCDLAMPGATGVEFIKRFRASEAGTGRRVPAAACSGFSGQEYTAEALESGFDVHVRKPIEPLMLATVVEMLARPAK